MTATRKKAARLLRQGLSDRAVARRLNMDRRAVARIRADLKLDKAIRYQQPARNLEDAFRQRTQDAGDGHLAWTGYRTSKGVPAIHYDGRQVTAYRIAWWLRTGREPQGCVRPICGMRGCVAPDHVDDAATRHRTSEVYAAIFGQVNAS